VESELDELEEEVLAESESELEEEESADSEEEEEELELELELVCHESSKEPLPRLAARAKTKVLVSDLSTSKINLRSANLRVLGPKTPRFKKQVGPWKRRTKRAHPERDSCSSL